MEYFVHDEQSSVHRLPVHLPGEQPIYFPPNLSSQQLRDRLKTAKSELMRFFEYNRLHADGKDVLYQNWSENHVWKAPLKR